MTGTSELGVPVIDALVEPRYDDALVPNARLGDRVDVVTGSELRSYDLETRALVASVPLDGAAALAIDPSLHLLYIGSSDGTIWTLDLTSLDAVRQAGSAVMLAEPSQLGQVDGAITRLYVPDDGSGLLVVTDDDQVRALDPITAEELGSAQLENVADIGPGGTAPSLVGAPDAVEDPARAAAAIAAILGGSTDTYAARLDGTTDRLVIAGIPDSATQTSIQAAIDDGRLAGLTIETLPRAAVADANGLEILDPATGDVTDRVDLGGAAHGLALTTVDGAKLYVSTDPDPATEAKGRISLVAVGGTEAKDGPFLVAAMEMPGPVTRVAYDEATEMVHVLGRTPDGAASTIYVIEPHGRAVYADARLPIEPSAWAIDVNRPYPTDDRQQILVFDGAGDTASVDVGKHEFAWRLPGVLAGAAMAGFLFLLARILFRRRAVALVVAVLCVADGMLFVQSRIGMNDAYVGLGIVAAYTLFAALWMGVWRHRGAFWIGMPLIGLAPRAGPRRQVGRPVRDRRAVLPRPDPERPRPPAGDRPPRPDDRGAGLSRDQRAPGDRPRATCPSSRSWSG